MKKKNQKYLRFSLVKNSGDKTAAAGSPRTLGKGNRQKGVLKISYRHLPECSARARHLHSVSQGLLSGREVKRRRGSIPSGFHGALLARQQVAEPRSHSRRPAFLQKDGTFNELQ